MLFYINIPHCGNLVDPYTCTEKIIKDLIEFVESLCFPIKYDRINNHVYRKMV